MGEEVWLSLRDEKTKRIVKHVKLSSEVANREDFSKLLTHVKSLISRIDTKYMGLIKSSIQYGFQGLVDEHGADDITVSIIKYNLQADLNTLADAIGFDLGTNYCNPRETKNAIDTVSHLYYYCRTVRPIASSTSEGQNIMLENKIRTLSETHNRYIDFLEGNYDFHRNCLMLTVPQNYSDVLYLSSAIETTSVNIEEIRKLKVMEENLLE